MQSFCPSGLNHGAQKTPKLGPDERAKGPWLTKHEPALRHDEPCVLVACWFLGMLYDAGPDKVKRVQVRKQSLGRIQVYVDRLGRRQRNRDKVYLLVFNRSVAQRSVITTRASNFPARSVRSRRGGSKATKGFRASPAQIHN